MRRYIYIFLAVIIPCIQAHAIEPQVTDFMSGAPVEARADGGLWELILPQSVYEGLVRQDIGDIRIFDGAGLQIPLKIVDGRKGFLEEPKAQSLNFFPLLTRGDGFIDMSTTRFRMDETGAIAGVDSQANAGEGNVLTSYVIDASHLEGEPEALRLQWSDKPGKFVTTVDVKASRDLAFWFGLSSSSTLAQIPCGQMMFFQDTLEIPKAMEGYWLVTWPGGKKGSTIDHVEVIYPSEQSARAPIWTQATARGAGVNGEYQFEIGAPLPASQVKIHVMWPDFCSRAKVYSRGSQDSNWEFHADTTLYNLAAGDNNIQNGALDVRPVNHRFWKVQIDPDSTASAGPLPPTFQVGWTSHTVYFVATGKEPYVLAFGSGRENLSLPPQDPVLEPIGWGKPGVVAAPARIGAIYTLGGNNALFPNRPIPPDPRKKQMILMAGGVVALGLLIVIGLLIRMLLVKKKAAAKAEIEAVQKEDEWAEAQAAAETEAFGDTLDQEEIAAEAKEMSDAWGLPDQDDVDKVVSDSETMIGADGGGESAPLPEEQAPQTQPEPAPEEIPALLQEEPEYEAPEKIKDSPQSVPVQLGDDGTLDQDQLDMLLTRSGLSDGPSRPKKEYKPKKSPEESSIDPNEGILNQDDLDALLATQAEDDSSSGAALDESNALNQDDLDALLATQVDMHSPGLSPTPQVNEDGTLDQAALDALLATQPVKESHPPREPKRPAQPQYKANEDGTLNQAALNALLKNAGYNVTVPAEEVPQTEELPFEGALDQDQLNQILEESEGPGMEQEPEPEPAPVIKQFSQDELDDLFDGAGKLDDWAPPPKEPEPEPLPPKPVPKALQTDGQLSQADLDAFFDTHSKPEPEPDDSAAMSQDDLDAMFDAPPKTAPKPEPDDNAAMSQDDLDAMFDAPPKTAPKPKPDDNAAMSQDDLDAMFDAPPKTAPEPVAEKPKPKQVPSSKDPASPQERGIAPVFQTAGKKGKAS